MGQNPSLCKTFVNPFTRQWTRVVNYLLALTSNTAVKKKIPVGGIITSASLLLGPAKPPWTSLYENTLLPLLVPTLSPNASPSPPLQVSSPQPAQPPISPPPLGVTSERLDLSPVTMDTTPVC